MSRKNRTTTSGVEHLLEQRRLFQDWLTKLSGGAGETMPGHVVEKVRNDYRTRLAGVMTELAQHDDSIRQALAEAQGRHESLERQQQAAKDELAEVRLRKQVGELDDAVFKEINTRLKGTIDESSKDLAASLRDIERYEEIIELIAAEGVPAAPVAEPAVVAQGSESEAAPEHPASQIDALEEMAFLQSVTGVMAPPKRLSRLVGRVAEPEPQGSPKAAPEPAAAIVAPPAEIQVVRDQAPEEPEAAVEERGSKQVAEAEQHTEDTRAAQAEGKALVCGECGAPNLPTEWYCEKCGAELSAF
ncbi:MAG: zinc ribbon domain-containing protein [Gemmatimonadales bacterium]|nr:zinc ribbon domain-containing protein [Gemmatimonadales bacterium]